MNSRLNRAIALATAISCLAAFSAWSEAHAGRDSEIYQKSYDLEKPLHGYEGWASSRKYCSYKRFPKRECAFDRRKGREICKVVGWELEQTCY